jgi:uncharacterized protein YrrD
MRLGKDLTGKPIYSITDGQNLGSVKDVYFDKDLSIITGIFTGTEGLLKRKSLMIPSNQVSVYGIDAILVKDNDVIVQEDTNADAADWVRLSKLKGRDVDTPGGTKVATIGDVVLGEQGNIVGFTLSKVHVDGPIAQQGQITRSAIVDTGNEDGIMTINLTQAEVGQPETKSTENASAKGEGEVNTAVSEKTPAPPADELDTLSQ